MEIKEIKTEELDPKKFIEEKIEDIRKIVGEEKAIVALSGGVDSSVTTMLARKALGDRLKVVFIDNGLMREDEPEWVASVFEKLGIHVEIVEAGEQFFDSLIGVTDPEKKRKIFRETFYGVFAEEVKKSGAKILFQGTNYTDIEETVAGIKTQHNILEQLGINPEEKFGYMVIEPLKQLRKDGVRNVAKSLDLPPAIYNRRPFPGPALAIRVRGEVTREKIRIVRKATKIVEEELRLSPAFQYLAILHQGRVTGIRNGKRAFGWEIQIRCWDSTDATTATPTELNRGFKKRLVQRIITEIPEIVSVNFHETPKPPSTIEGE